MLIWDSGHNRLISVGDRDPTGPEHLMVTRSFRQMMHQAAVVVGGFVNAPEHWGWPRATSGDDRGRS